MRSCGRLESRAEQAICALSLARPRATIDDAEMSVKANQITTDRLTLRPFKRHDLNAFVAYRSDPGVARYQSWEETYSIAEAESFLASQENVVLGQSGKWLQLAIFDGQTNTLHGDCAMRFVADQPATAEVGVTLAPSSQGKGIAAEALAAVVTMLIDEHEIHRVLAHVDDRNVASWRLFERLGFRCEGRLVAADWFKGEWATLRVYAVLESEWQRR